MNGGAKTIKNELETGHPTSGKGWVEIKSAKWESQTVHSSLETGKGNNIRPRKERNTARNLKQYIKTSGA
jgi:hypothetical protein